MSYLEDYISIINNYELIETVKSTANQLVTEIANRFDFRNQLNGLLLGNVQSGKTGQMLGAISLLADKGYRLFILLTTDNVDLQRQTYLRVRDSLSNFTVLSEKDEIIFSQRGLSKPVVIVLKKNSSVLRKWKNLLVSTNTCRGLSLVIFDDEADAASLNTLVNKRRVSTINRNLQAIKESSAASIYIQVTATPQAIILQGEESGWKPAFVTYFKPGSKYLGGNFFYSNPPSYCAKFTDDDEVDNVVSDFIDGGACPRGLHDSIVTFLMNCAHKRINGENNCNFMIHPSVRISTHNAFVNRVQEELNLLVNSLDDPEF